MNSSQLVKTLTFCLALTCTTFSNLWGQDDSPTVKFSHKLLTVDANEGIDLADINQDGKLDVIAGRNWYPAPDFA